jgi:hypothetical protein
MLAEKNSNTVAQKKSGNDEAMKKTEKTVLKKVHKRETEMEKEIDN